MDPNNQFENNTEPQSAPLVDSAVSDQPLSQASPAPSTSPSTNPAPISNNRPENFQTPVPNPDLASPADNKPGKIKMWAIIVSVILMLLIVAGVAVFLFVRGQSSNKASDKSSDKIVSVTPLKNNWPKDFPVIPPTYPDGKFEKVSSNPGSNEWSLNINDSSMTTMDSYKKTLLANGWKEEDSPATAVGLTTIGFSKNGYVMAISYVDDKSNKSFLVRIANIAREEALPANTTVIGN